MKHNYNNVQRSDRCPTCHGYGKLYEEVDNAGTECGDCLGVGINLLKENQEDREFISNMFNVLTSDRDWREQRERIIGILETNPALRIVDVHDDPDTFIITFRSHAFLIKDGKLKKFF